MKQKAIKLGSFIGTVAIVSILAYKRIKQQEQDVIDIEVSVADEEVDTRN